MPKDLENALRRKNSMSAERNRERWYISKVAMSVWGGSEHSGALDTPTPSLFATNLKTNLDSNCKTLYHALSFTKGYVLSYSSNCFRSKNIKLEECGGGEQQVLGA
eukprot:1175512-Prorocentrum_minimum.AAC.7